MLGGIGLLQTELLGQLAGGKLAVAELFEDRDSSGVGEGLKISALS